MRKILLCLGAIVSAVLLLAVPARAQISVTGNLKDLGANNATSSSTWVAFTLQNYGSAIPTISGTNVIVGPIAPLFKPNGSGIISGTIQPNDTISPSGTYYQVCIYSQGQSQWCQNYIINSTPNPFNLNSAAPMSNPVSSPTQVLGARSFVFTQTASSSTWRVVHNFNDTDVLTQCFTAAGVQLTPSSLTVTDPNTVTVVFGSAQTGYCVVLDGSQQVLTNAPANAIVGNPTANQTISGAYQFNIPTSGNAAVKPAASDAYFYVSGNGSDTTGDGLSGGSAYATWAKAKTSCGSTPCVVTILETAASAGCPDTTATIVTFDYRSLATPCGNNTISMNNPGSGSTISASLSRTSLFLSSPTVSAAAGIFFGTYTGALPASQSNEGLNGTTSTSGTISSVGSAFHLIGVEGSVSVQSNGQTLPDVRGLTGNCNLASGTTNVTKCSSVYAQAPTNTGTGTLTNAISFYAEMPTAGGTLNQAGHFDGQVTVGGTPGSPRVFIDKNADGQIEGSIFTLLSSGGGTLTLQAPNTASSLTASLPILATNTSNCAVTGVTFANCSGFSFPVTSGAIYRGVCTFQGTSSVNATSAEAQWTIPGGYAQWFQSGTEQATTSMTIPLSFSDSTSTQQTTLSFVFIPNSSGTAQLQIADGTAGDVATLNAGSFCTVQ